MPLSDRLDFLEPLYETPEGCMDPFAHGSLDASSDRLHLPQGLYGRAAELAALEGAFSRVQQGTPELLLLGGRSGIGKSSLIHEFYRSPSQTRGYLVSGKCEPRKRDLPYGALLQALAELVRSVLAESAEERAVAAGRIRAAVRGAGRVLTDVLPELGIVIGPQPPVDELPAAESGDRFRLAFEGLLQAFTCHGQPLVVFLDDLQWADAATLDLLSSLLSGQHAGALLWIGAYQDHEVSAGDPLLQAASALEAGGCRVSRLALGPIREGDVADLCRDALSLDRAEVAPLAAHLFRRTGGHPLFVGELLMKLSRQGLLAFDPGRLCWTFDLARIERAASTDNAAGSWDVSSLIQASQALSGEIALDKLLLRLMDLLAENAGAERGALVQQQGDALTVAAEFDVRGGARLPSRAAPLDESAGVSQAIVTYVIQTRKSVVLANAATEGMFTGDAYVIQRRPRAILCAPLVQKGEVHGALYLENNRVPGAFTPKRAELLSVLCAQTAISLDNAQRYAELDRKVRERTGALAEAQVRLLRIEKATTEMQMAGGFAHEMRNALAGAKLMLARVYRAGNAETGGSAMWSACLDNSDRLASVFLKVRDHVPESTLDEVARLIRATNVTEEQVHEILRGVGQALDRGLGITKLLLDYSHIGQDARGDEPVSVTSLVDAVLLVLREDLAQKHIALHVDVPAGQVLVGSELHFHSILGNLVLNARDALLEVADDRPLEIRVGSVVERGGLVLSVSDTGVGIPAEVRDRVFDPFFSTKPRTGTGLGLAMVRKLALLYDADVELESVPGRSTTFRVVFPSHRVRRAW